MIRHDWLCTDCAKALVGDPFEEASIGSPGEPTPCAECGRKGHYDLRLPIGTYRWVGVELHFVPRRIPGPEFPGWRSYKFEATEAPQLLFRIQLEPGAASFVLSGADAEDAASVAAAKIQAEGGSPMLGLGAGGPVVVDAKRMGWAEKYSAALRDGKK